MEKRIQVTPVPCDLVIEPSNVIIVEYYMRRKGRHYFRGDGYKVSAKINLEVNPLKIGEMYELIIE